ncbi:Hsp20 family protein [Maritalea mediterranea]|uniref:Hsp20 family protein n=1 Tax=Maritalea mediterranea TaxID=2909667 RepID=A0ABS9E9N6_9HYPH|nr:Hsp20 family protein [Maritalea mediterranea]MCF4099590.1 Hsp20 family protein [Maritalea mediterranea]
MNTLDLSPFYRSTVGFDRLFNLLDDLSPQEPNAFPPYNIERTGEDTYRISMAVAGFSKDDLVIETKENAIIVKGAKSQSESEQSRDFLHRGIAERSFERRFKLADYVEVRGADLENGLLHIELARELPESKRPRKIAIGTDSGTEQKKIEGELKN